MKELETKKEEYKSIIKGYHNGLEKLEASKASIEIMSKKISEEKVKVNFRKNEVETLAHQVHENKKEAEKSQKEAIEKQAILEKQEIQIA